MIQDPTRAEHSVYASSYIHNTMSSSKLRQLTWREGRSLAVHPSISLTPTSKRGLMTPHLFSLPFNSTTILPDLWSSTYSNSPMYPTIKRTESATDSQRATTKQNMQVVELTVLLHDDKELDNDLGRRPDHDLPLPTLLSVVHALESIVQDANPHHPYLTYRDRHKDL